MAGSRRRWSPDAVVVVVLLLLHFALYRFFIRWPALPNFLVGGLLLTALRVRAGHAAFAGFGLGILEASMALEGLGTISIVLAIIAFFGARSRDLLFADARHYVFVYLFVGTWVTELALMLAMPGGPSLAAGLVLAPASALGTALVCGGAEAAAAAIRRP